MARWPNAAQKNHIFQSIGYQPFEEQIPIHMSTKDVIQIVGAEGAGKSQVTAMEILASVFWAKLIYLIGETYDNPRKEFSYLEEGLVRLGAIGTVQASKPKVGQWAMITRTGCQIKTLSAREGASAVIATGQEPDLFVLCEAGIINSYALFTACVRRITRSKGKVILSGTLKDNYGWYASLIDDLSVKDNLWNGQYFSLPAWINKVLYPSGKNDPEIIRLKKILPPDEFSRTIAAEKIPSPALVFPEFSYAQHVKDCPYDPLLPVTVWVDPGYYPSAYCVLPVQFHGDEVWIIDEIYLNHHTHTDVINFLKQKEYWKSVKDGVIDFAGRQHHAEKSAIEVWQSETSLYLRSQPVSILDGITRHRSYLGGERIRLFHDPKCRYTLQEYKQYRRPTDKDGNATSDLPKDENNHAMKAIAYGLVDKFGYIENYKPMDILEYNPFYA